MKKIFISVIVLVLCLVMTIPSLAWSWGDISDKSLVSNYDTENTRNNYFNDIPLEFKQYIHSEPYTLYLRIIVGVNNDFPLLDIYQDIPQQYATDSPFASTLVRDVTTLISFGSSNSLKPSQVFMEEVASGANMLDVTPKDDQNIDSFWLAYDSQFPGNYDVESTRYPHRIPFVLKYNIDPSLAISTYNSPVSFYDKNNYIDLTPMINSSTAYIGQVSINVRSLYTVFNKSVVASYINGVDNGDYTLLLSTNFFSMSDIVMDLYFWFEGAIPYRYKKSNNWQLEVQAMFTQGNENRFGLSKVFDSTIPFMNRPISPQVAQGIFYSSSFQFGNYDVYNYGVSYVGNDLRYGKARNDTDALPTQTYYSGYRYKCNMNTECSGLKFSVTQLVSYQQQYIAITTPNDITINGDIDISQFYKDTRIDIPEGTEWYNVIPAFFKQLFVVVLPNIINNFIVWFMCESPLISVITRPLFLLANFTLKSALFWVVPVIGSLGIFGSIVFIIFIIKRLLPHLLGGHDD